MIAVEHSFSDREFKIWDYLVSHRQMVIRSLGPEEDSPNLDLHFRGVEFVRAPTVFRGLSVVAPTDAEVAEAEALVGPPGFDRFTVWVLESGEHRHLVVAESLDVAETDFPTMSTALIHPAS